MVDKEGADVNWRDKGGYCPIDYAAMNNDMEHIQILLEAGATLRRENAMLRAKRRAILKNVYDPDVYRVLNEHLKREEAEFQAREKQRFDELNAVDYDKQAAKLHMALAKKNRCVQHKRNWI